MSPSPIELLLRISILEGIAGVPQRTWCGRGDARSLRNGFVQAREALPTLHDSWWCDASILKASFKTLNEDERMEVLASLMARGLYELGKSTPIDATLQGVCSHLNLYVWRRKTATGRPTQKLATREYLAVSQAQTRDAVDLAGSQVFRAWLVDFVNQAFANVPGKLRVASLWAQDPNMSAVDIGRALGLSLAGGSSPWAASVIRETTTLLRNAVRSGRVPTDIANYIEG